MIKVTLIALLVLTGILQLHNAFIYPSTRGFDALNHIDYIEYLKYERRIPLPEEGWELYQPPFYYFLASFFPSFSSIKILGFLSWAALVYLSFQLYKRKFKNIMIALIGTLIVSSLPVVLYLTFPISNEFFSSVMISACLVYYLIHEERFSSRSKIFFGILLGLSLLAKATAFVLLISILISALWLQRGNIRTVARDLYIPFIVAAVISGWFYLRNLIIYKNPFIASVDFPEFTIHQVPGYRDLRFFTDLSGFLKMDLFTSHFYSLLSGTYFSWFYDGHNVIVPVQSFSKIGVLLVLFSLPLFLLSIIGYLKEIRISAKKKNLVLIMYPLLLFLGYVLYNFKLPFYSTVKGAFLVSLVIPFGYFFCKGVEHYQKYLHLISLYFILYTIIIFKNFWIIPSWHRQ